MITWRRSIVTIVIALATAASSSAATFVVTNAGMSGPGTVRQAIVDANATPGRDAITFTTNVDPGYVLPTITDPVDIDGTLPDGSRVSIASPFPGLNVGPGGSGSTVQDLVANGIYIHVGATDVGVYRTTMRNVAPDFSITARGSRAILGSEGNGNIIPMLWLEGDSHVVVGNDIRRIDAKGSNHRIAGNTIRSYIWAIDTPGIAIEDNVFPSVWPTERAIHVYGHGTARVLINGNRITGPGNGIEVEGPAQVHRNVLNYVRSAISVAGNNVDISRNIIIDAQSAISIAAGANDPPPDADTGPNNRQNHPILTVARRSALGLVVGGFLESAPSTPYEIELFASPLSDPKAHAFLGSAMVTTNPDGRVSFEQVFTSNLPAVTDVVTATATNRGTTTSPGNAPNETSALSAPLRVNDITALSTPALSLPTLLALALALAIVGMLRTNFSFD